MPSDVVVKVEGLHKKFCRSLKRSMFYGSLETIQSAFGIAPRSDSLRKSEFWAIEDLSFELERGEALGIIGRNGGGKSTLLRLLTGIYLPDAGRVEVYGSIGALIAVGAGFHPHMTGRENIYLNGTVLGMSRREIKAKIDDIIEFADIGTGIDAPSITYSSGMRVRLGFSIAVHTEPDILLIDEVLAVGDMSFRNKAMRKMAEFRRRASGLLFVSHNMDQIAMLCKRVLVLDDGKIVFNGPTEKAIAFYESLSQERAVERYRRRKVNYGQIGDRLKIEKVCLRDSQGQPQYETGVGEPLHITIDVEGEPDLNPVNMIVTVGDEASKTRLLRVREEGLELQGKRRVHVVFDNHHLLQGVFFVTLTFRDAETGEYHARAFREVERPIRVVSRGLAYKQQAVINAAHQLDVEKR